MNATTIASQIRAHRKRRRESQGRVASRLGTTQQVVSRVERGEASLEQIVRLCKALALPLAVEIGGHRIQMVYPIDPEERRAIEANIDWFARLDPARRLRAIALHVDASRRLREAASRGR